MSHARPTILVVEDDLATRTFLADNLTADGYELLVADCTRDALRLLETRSADLAIVDVGLPDGSGLDLIARVRSADGLASRIDPRLPVIVVSGRAAEVDRVRGLERGADDYIVKPFSYVELRERVRAVLRRSSLRGRLGRQRVGELDIDPASRVVLLRGSRVELSQKEFALLRALAVEPTKVFTRVPQGSTTSTLSARGARASPTARQLIESEKKNKNTGELAPRRRHPIRTTSLRDRTLGAARKTGREPRRWAGKASETTGQAPDRPHENQQSRDEMSQAVTFLLKA